MFYHGFYYPYLQMYYLQNLMYLAAQGNYMVYEMKIKIDEIYEMIKKPVHVMESAQLEAEDTVSPPTTGSLPAGGGMNNGLGRVVEVRIDDQVFSPFLLTVSKGTTVVWKNTDHRDHTVTAEDGSFDSGILKSGQSYSRTFQSPGIYPYYSGKDPMLRGTVQVL